MSKLIMHILGTLLFIATLISCNTHGQDTIRVSDSLNRYQNRVFFGIIDSTLTQKYPFIHFEKNHYQFYTENSPNFEKLFYNFQQMVKMKDRKLNFYHIGGSHLQADIHTHEMRTNLQKHWPGLEGERGMIFPFDLAGTNSPWNYEFKSTNKWKDYRSTTDRPDSIDYGILGAIIECPDSSIYISFEYDKTIVKPGFDKIRIYHNKGHLPYELNFGEDEIFVLRKQNNPRIGYTDVFFTDKLESFELYMSRDTVMDYKLRIHGFQLSNKEPGISYTSIGVNGASLPTYLKNKNFLEQLKEFPPDFFAFSVGTNDANTTYAGFKPEVYKANLDSLIQLVLKANPNCALLLTVPNDAFFRKKHLNKNVAREREMIIELAKKYEAAVWDFYGIMGELGAAKLWYKKGLMKGDLVHFTAAGYRLKGDMFFESYLKWLEQMDIRQKQSYLRKEEE
ncbi:MAG: GDSL-type esterase/lipase family protein [Flavobacteriia bacterium]